MSWFSSHFFSEQERNLVVNAIREAEQQTSGEIRVHLERHCKGDVMQRATAVFFELKMHETVSKNGVLIYIAYRDHKFAVIGDSGIHEKVGAAFWNETADSLRAELQQQHNAEGVAQAVRKIGAALREHFPFRHNDKNELSDDVSVG